MPIFDAMKKEDCYFLGTLSKTHGLQGNIILKLDTDQPELYDRLEGVYLDINGLLTPFFVETQSWLKSDAKLIKFKNGTLAQAEQLVGREVYLPLSTLPKLEGNQFYYHEVLGFSVYDTDGSLAGVIHQINDQTAQHYFILKLGGREIIIPIVKDWIVEVNREARKIEMQLPEGLLDVF